MRTKTLYVHAEFKAVGFRAVLTGEEPLSLRPQHNMPPKNLLTRRGTVQPTSIFHEDTAKVEAETQKDIGLLHWKIKVGKFQALVSKPHLHLSIYCQVTLPGLCHASWRYLPRCAERQTSTGCPRPSFDGAVRLWQSQGHDGLGLSG